MIRRISSTNSSISGYGRGSVYISQEDRHTENGMENVFRIGMTFKKKLRRIFGPYGTILSIYHCKNPFRTKSIIIKELTETFGEPFSESNTDKFNNDKCYFYGEKSVIVNLFYDIVGRLAKRERGTGRIVPRCDHLSHIFPKFARDVNFIGNKRLVVMNWTLGTVKYIEGCRLKSKNISEFIKKFTNIGYFGTVYTQQAMKEGQVVNIANPYLIRALDSKKIDITLDHEFPQLAILSNKFCSHKSNRKISTATHINNLVFKNGIIRSKRSFDRMYCMVEYDKYADIYMVTVDTCGIPEYKKLKYFTIYVKRVNGKYYTINFLKNKGVNIDLLDAEPKPERTIELLEMNKLIDGMKKLKF